MGSRSRLEQRLQDMHMSQSDALRQFTVEARRLGEGEVHVSARQMKRWLAGDAAVPRQVACRVLEGWLQEPVRRLLGRSYSAAFGGGRGMRWSGVSA